MRTCVGQTLPLASGEVQLDNDLVRRDILSEACSDQVVVWEVATTEWFEFSAKAQIGHLGCRVVVEFHQYLSVG